MLSYMQYYIYIPIFRPIDSHGLEIKSFTVITGIITYTVTRCKAFRTQTKIL